MFYNIAYLVESLGIEDGEAVDSEPLKCHLVMVLLEHEMADKFFWKTSGFWRIDELKILLVSHDFKVLPKKIVIRFHYWKKSVHLGQVT